MSKQAHQNEILTRSATELADLVRREELAPREIIDASLVRIEEINPTFNAFIDVYREEALFHADAASAAIRNGDVTGPLHGVPVAIKDMTPIAGKRTTFGSRAFRDNIAKEDAWIVQALRKSGAIIIGKTTTPEFAFSSFTQSPLFGVTRNPHDVSRTSGGSSGGSAVAVAMGAVPLAEGTDMGGSVRIPASLCGIVGMKPSLGRVPLDILPSSFDNISHFGPLARCCADAALFVSATQGPDDCDIQSIATPFNYGGALDIDPKSLKIAVSMDFGFYSIDPEVERNTRNATQRLQQAGATIDYVDLGWSTEILSVWMDYWRVFMAAFFEEPYNRDASALDPAVKKLIEQGRDISAVHYKQLEIKRTEFWRSFSSVLKKYDALICPTTAITAPAATATDRDFGFTDSNGRYHGLDMTAPFNLIGQCPALSIPSGKTKVGLPTGLQIIGRRFDDLGVLKVGACLEKLIPGLPPSK